MIPVIIPAYEPDEKLIKLLDRIREENISPVIIVNDGSKKEESRRVLQQVASDYKDIVILKHAVNQGKGRALKTAFNYCLNEFDDMEGCITVDSDGQHRCEDMIACMEALKKNPRALIMGCRNFDEDGIPKRSLFGNKITSLVMKFLVGISVSDTQTGLRGISRDFMIRLMNVKGERFEFETNMLLETKEIGIPIEEVPIRTIYIEENKTSHFNPIKDSIKIYLLFGKFMFSSFSSSLIDLALFSLFCFLTKKLGSIGHFTYIHLSTVLARLVSASYNFSINYKIVFQSNGGIGRTLPRYALLVIIQMSLSAFFVNLLYPHFGGAEVVVKIIVDVILFLASYIIQREFIYKNPDKEI